MGQKIHPLGLRLGITQKHRSTWFADKRTYPRLMMEDRILRTYILKKYADAQIVDIKIERAQSVKNFKTGKNIEFVQIHIFTPKLNKILNVNDKKQTTKSIDDLSKELANLCEQARRNKKTPGLRLRVGVFNVEESYAEASIIADQLIEKLEGRTPFRSALKGVLKRVKEAKKLQGIRVQIAGRLNGAEIARTEWVRDGRVPLQTLRADVNYASKSAKTIYGILGIKVWAFKKEKI